jgi:hypothetical protein
LAVRQLVTLAPMWRLKLDNLILFGYFVAFVGSFWTGHAISALVWLLLALYHVQTDRLGRIENNQEQIERILRASIKDASEANNDGLDN